ncbi:tyrosine-type recombinase/integrase [Anaerofustis sp.]|uniref:tyrosine-type recombinase/integrase n=1 Tax=Anaerofustis sp. TaxID=1872517 RepID=UPI0025C566D1|nr:tyrosine-type recombinase/integrase [Anaerofustis sp.]
MENKLINEFLKNNNMSTSSNKGYAYDLNTFLSFMKKRNHIDNLDVKYEKDFYLSLNNIDMYAYVDYLRKELNNSDKTIARKISSIKNFYKFVNNKFSSTNEIVSFKFRYDNSSLKNETLNNEQIRDLIDYVKNIEPEKNQIIIFLMLFNGLTVKEVQNIKTGDIFDNNIIINKNSENERVIKINDALRAILSRFLFSNDQLYLLNSPSNPEKPISTRRIQEIVKNALKRIGIEEKGISSNILRNTSVKMLKEYNNAGFNEIKSFLGLKTDKQIERYLKDEKEEIDMNKNPFSKF